MIRPLLLLGLALFASNCYQSFAWDGPIKTRDNQCREKGFAGSCEKRHFGREFLDGPIKLLTDYSCEKLRCAKKKTGPINDGFRFEAVDAGDVLNGSNCGDSSICVEGQCVVLPKIALPKYSGDPKARILNCQ